jgi:chaperone required for assembly of F1-ATPase
MKRFYKDVAVAGTGPFEIHLDGRPVKTPKRAELALPTRLLAEAVADEWRSQGDDILPASMPLTKLANTAIDRVAGREGEVIDKVMAYANDHLCYRAGSPADLAMRQEIGWNPLLDWAAERLGARLETHVGVTHFDQPPEAVAALRRAVEAEPPFAFAALHNAATILNSLVLTLALAERRLNAEEAFGLAQLDERYQVEHWGEDHEATLRTRALAADLAATERFIRLVKG